MLLKSVQNVRQIYSQILEVFGVKLSAELLRRFLQLYKIRDLLGYLA